MSSQRYPSRLESRPEPLRYPRGSGRLLDASSIAGTPALCLDDSAECIPGRGELVIKGDSRVCIIAVGQRVLPCAEAALLVAQKNSHLATVFDACWVKPLPEEQILALAAENDALLLVEENSLLGGFSSSVLELLADNDMLNTIKVRRLGLPDRFIPHGPVRRLRDDVGLNVRGIAGALDELFSQLG